jgi:two-component system OmpR family sensor kinase
MNARHSMRRTLLLWLSAGLALALSLVAVVLFLQAREEANQLFDYQMEQVASALPRRFMASVPPGLEDRFEATPNVVIQIWDPTGVRVYFSHDVADLPQRAVLGFSTIEVRQQQWRVYSAQQGPTIVQIAQPLQVRSAMAARSALKTVAPLLLLVPFLGGLIWIAVGRGLAPIHDVAAELAARGAGQLGPVADSGLPDEIRPLTQAVNHLFARLEQAAGVQRVFIDDAAHELRTPLTALQLQVALAERAGDEAARAAAFAALRAGLERASRLVQQLLTLARQEPGARAPHWQPTDLAAIARAAVAELAPAADLCRVELGLTQAPDLNDTGTAAAPADARAMVRGDPDALRILVTNLLDNALKATPEGGHVELTIGRQAQQVLLQVEDTGPGIPPAELGRVFDRFFRGSGAPPGGSGLGLAIVRRIADLHRAEVSLVNTGTGLRAVVRLPADGAQPVDG